jgi:hypothetical protein
MNARRFSLLAILIVASLSVKTGETQTNGSGRDYLRHSLTGGFVYEVPVGSYPTFSSLNSAPGFAVNYSYRPRRWFALETGLEEIIRPVGTSICCRWVDSANDELYLVPFGARYVWEAKGGRVRLSVGGGGAYLNYQVNPQAASNFVFPYSAWGGQFVVSADYGLTRSGKFRIGFAGRYYRASAEVTLPYSGGTVLSTAVNLIVGGPVFTFSFH